jgi:hypothetical protein
VVQICSLLRGGIAERGGVRVGHRIIEINNQSVVAVPHEKIVNLLATSVGEVSKRAFILFVFMKFKRSKYFQAARFIFNTSGTEARFCLIFCFKHNIVIYKAKQRI